MYIPQSFNPILTGLFESKFLLGGGGVNLTPPSDLGPKGADRREDTCMDVKTHLKKYCYKICFAKNDLFIILLHAGLCKLACLLIINAINISNK